MEMNAHTKLARCPHCGSTFSATEAILEQAFGAVRCGECLKIFNAYHHLLLVDAPVEQELHSATASSTADINLSTTSVHSEHWAEPAGPSSAGALTASHTQVEHKGAQAFSTELFANEPEAAETSQTEASDTEPLSTEARPPSAQPAPWMASARHWWQSQMRPHPWRWGVGALLALVLLVGLSQLSFTPANPYLLREVRFAPSQEAGWLQVEFELSNPGGRTLPLPALQVDLLNLSQQSLSSQRFSPDDLRLNQQQLEPGTAVMIQLQVQRPRTLVHSVRVTAE
ncbi:DUF3426 domain-containing protein [Marinospirillum sp. MEB164]|uniref:DUF3426 domain-containing protein n=1 Tax=Marinospirillum alkalitolerans TaxID=3123374 RepID=A0ABW8PYG2_9GAMM